LRRYGALPVRRLARPRWNAANAIAPIDRWPQI